MSVMAGQKFACVSTICLPFATVGATNVRRCQMACLARDQCQAATFQQSTGTCQLFSDSSGNLTPDTGTTTMIGISETRMPPPAKFDMTASPPLSTYPSLWSFYNNTLDSLSGFNGFSIDSPTYEIPEINGYGCALSVNGSIGQYVDIPTYRHLTYISFTIEMWFYLTHFPDGDYGLFGQHYASTLDQSLHCMVRGDVMFFGFFQDDLYGSTPLEVNNWYHVTFVFDYFKLTKQIYLNGILDASRNSSFYQGLNGSIVIEKTEQIVVAGWHNMVNIEIIDPVFPANVWTHVMSTYSSTSDLRFYVNETYYNSTDAFEYVASGEVNILTLGNSLQAVSFDDGGECNSQSIVSDPYDGLLDEFRVYSRELNSFDADTLANP